MDHILELNPEITDPNLIPVKQKIKIPEITESLLVKQSSDGTCSIHLATFSNPRHAARYVNEIDFKGKEVKVVPLKVSRTDAWYRVMAGPFADRSEALKAVDEMKKKDLLPSFQQP
jgi:cell division septation protein DedD